MNTTPSYFADRLQGVETSAIRELFKLLGQPGMISFAGGFPDAALFDVEGLRAASAQALQDSADAALQYGATEGYGPLRALLAAHMQAKGAQAVEPSDLVVTTGSQQALDLVGKTLINPGDKVLVEGPTFLAAIQCFRLYGADLHTVPVDDDGVDVAALEASIARHRPKLIYLIPTFGNPSGACLSLARRRRVLALARQYQVLVLEDNPYEELYFAAPPPPSLLALSHEPAAQGSREWLLHCGSLSKVVAPGLRIGWIIAPPQLLAAAVMCKQFSDAHTSTFAQAAAACYLQAGRLPAALARVRNAYAQRAQALCLGLQREFGSAIAFKPPKGGMFVWARLTQHLAQDLARAALAEKVAFVPAEPFYARAANRHSLRLSFATTDLDAIEQGVQGLGRAYRSL